MKYWEIFSQPPGKYIPKKISKNQRLFNEIYKVTACLDSTYDLRARVQFILELRTTIPTCCVCGNPTSYYKQTQTFNRRCSAKCKQQDPAVRQKIENTCMERYGVRAGCIASSAIEKQAATNMERYGVKRPFQSKIIQQKVIDTVRAMGVTSTALLDDVRKRQETTNMERYGVKKPFESAEIQQKVNQTFLNSIDVPRPSMTMSPSNYAILTNPAEMYNLHVNKQKPLRKIGEELGTSGSTVGKYLQRHNIEKRHFIISEGEKEVSEFVETLGVFVIRNTRQVISPKELDIYIPSHNIAIEFCGVYWHSEKLGKSRMYHKEKQSACKEKGIQLLTIYDWEWNNRRSQVEHTIRMLLEGGITTINTDNYYVQMLTATQSAEFFDAYHVQGAMSGDINYGLFCSDKLESAIVVDKNESGYNVRGHASVRRVRGALSTLIDHFRCNHCPGKLISDVDLRWNDGSEYSMSGFDVECELPPDYDYVVGSDLMYKHEIQLDEQGQEVIDRIWDCGKLRYVIEK